MNTADFQNIYCNPFVTDATRARKLQEDIAYAFLNFDKDTTQMTNVLNRLKGIISEATNTKLRDGESHILGIMTTSDAFNVPRKLAMSPHPDDARIAFVVGMPISKEVKPGVWNLHIKKRYVIAMCVLNASKVYLSKLYPTEEVTVQHAVGSAHNPYIREEGKRIAGDKTPCSKVCDLGAEAMAAAHNYTKDQIEKLMDESISTFNTLVTGLQQMGTGSVHDAPLLKRAHSNVLPERSVSTAIAEITSDMKNLLGEAPKMAHESIQRA